MATFTKFEEILAWQKARQLTCDVYRIARTSPIAKDYELNNQLRRAAISIMSNIAEGFGRRSSKDFAHFLDIARGSAAEVQSLLYVALDASYLSHGEFNQLYQLTNETVALIAGLTTYLRRTKATLPSNFPTPNS